MAVVAAVEVAVAVLAALPTAVLSTSLVAVPEPVAKLVEDVVSREVGTFPVAVAAAVAVPPSIAADAWAVPSAVPIAVAARVEAAVPVVPARPLALPSASREVTAASTAAAPEAILLMRR